MREKIISEIQRVAQEKGTPPGQKLFSRETGIDEGEWKGVFWARWGDALEEAGFKPNSKQGRHSDDDILRVYCEATRHFGHPPNKHEIRMYSKTEPNCPAYVTLTRHFGSIANARAQARQWAEANSAFADVVSLIPVVEPSTRTETPTSHQDGWVYLLKSGRHYKIGRGQDIERRVKQISVSLPERVELVHAIQTDDPSGIENYWHRRFADRRANGEWFNPTAADLKAFKRRKFQ